MDNGLERVLKMAISYSGKASDHEANHANPDHGLAMIQAHLIVSAEAARFVKPAKGPFHNPALGQHPEALGLVATAHDFQMQFAEGPQLLDPLNELAQIATIGPDYRRAVKTSQ